MILNPITIDSCREANTSTKIHSIRTHTGIGSALVVNAVARNG